MKNIKTFEQHSSVREHYIPHIDPSTAALMMATPFILLGMSKGYNKVMQFLDKVEFEIAKKKLGPLFDKVKGDREIQRLLNQLEEYKNYLQFGEEEGRNPRKEEAFHIRDAFYKRIKKLLSEKDWKKFKEYANEVEDGMFKPAGYFINPDTKYTRYRKLGKTRDRIGDI